MIILPDNIKTIEGSAFRDCSELKEVDLNKVETIGSYAFDGCNNLTIYCEANSKPDGWDFNWNLSNCPVVWGYKK